MFMKDYNQIVYFCTNLIEIVPCQADDKYADSIKFEILKKSYAA